MPSTSTAVEEQLQSHFQRNPHKLISSAELENIGGIGHWKRSVRSLYERRGWHIISGRTLKEILLEELPIHFHSYLSRIEDDDRILLDTEPDRDAAYRWHIARYIRKAGGSVEENILTLLRENVGHPVTGEELRYVANDKTEWARRTRELRTEHGWPIVTRNTGRPELPIGVYLLEEDRQSPEHDRGIPDEVRGSVLHRDNYTCRRCAWSHAFYNRSDPRHLELHHIYEHTQGGANIENNLITLCTVCHDAWHAARRTIDGFADWLAGTDA